MKLSFFKDSLCTDRRFLIRACAISLLLIFAAHAFCFFNLTYSADSVMLSVSRGRNAQTAGGQYLQPFYWRVRGGISSPLLVGLLSALYLTLSVILTAELLHLRSTAALFTLAGSLIVSPAVTSVCASSLHTADAAFLSLLLCAGGAFLLFRMRFGFLPAMCLLAAASALCADAPACFAAFSLLALIQSVLSRASRRMCLRQAVCAAAALLGGLALYAAGHFVLLRAYGLDSSAALQTNRCASLPDAWLYPVRMLFAPLTAYPSVSIALRALLLLCGAAALLSVSGSLSAARRAALVICVLALPLAVNLPVFSAESADQTSLAFFLADALIILLLWQNADSLFSCRMRRAAVCFYAVLFLGGAVFSNQVYLKKNLEYTSTLSVMTRVIDRMEQTPGYQSGATPVAITGSLEDSVFAVPRAGFEHLEALDAAKDRYLSGSYDTHVWYMWNILGYPCNFVSSYEHALLENNEKVKAMPAFPQDGCCAFIGDTLVIRLSD